MKPLPLACCKPRLQRETRAPAEEPWLREEGWINVAAKVEDNGECYFVLSVETPILAGDCLCPGVRMDMATASKTSTATWRPQADEILDNDNVRWARERRTQPTYINDAVERRAMRQKLVDAHPDNPRNRGA